jgi:hypothetical protein
MQDKDQRRAEPLFDFVSSFILVFIPKGLCDKYKQGTNERLQKYDDLLSPKRVCRCAEDIIADITP